MTQKGLRTVNIRDEEFKKLGHLCVENDKTRSDMLRIMVDYYLKHHPEG